MILDSEPLSYFDFPAPGSQILLSYPVENRHYFGRDPRRLKYRDRLVIVQTVEDGQQIPIPIESFLQRPTVIRRRWRLIAWEAAKRALRTVYLGGERPCKLQLGLWDPKSGQCLERIGDSYEQTTECLLELQRAFNQLLDDPRHADDGPTFAIYAAEPHSWVARGLWNGLPGALVLVFTASTSRHQVHRFFSNTHSQRSVDIAKLLPS